MITIRFLSPAGKIHRLVLTASIAGMLNFSGCERKPALSEPAPSPLPPSLAVEKDAYNTTFDTTRLAATIQNYEKTPNVENKTWVRLAFSIIDAEIIELGDTVIKTTGADREEASSKLKDLQKYRDREMARYTKSHDSTASDVSMPPDSRTAAEKLEDAAVDVSRKVAVEAGKVGKTLEKAADKTGSAIKNATQGQAGKQ
jgi:hypothetical protein